jgi:hypothetical protein
MMIACRWSVRGALDNLNDQHVLDCVPCVYESTDWLHISNVALVIDIKSILGCMCSEYLVTLETMLEVLCNYLLFCHTQRFCKWPNGIA